MNKFAHDIVRNIKDGALILYRGGVIFFDKKGTTLASSSTFYALITIIPFLLLLVRGIGYFLGNVNRTQRYIFKLGSQFFPDVAPEFLTTIQTMLKGPLFAGTEFTILNFFVLAISTITFLNSIWMGIFFITEDKNILSLWRILKGFVIIAMTLAMVTLIFLLPPTIIYILKLIQKSSFTQFFYETFETLRPAITFLKSRSLRRSIWINSVYLHLSLILVYFTVLYRWLFSWKITFKEAFVASLTFSLSVFVGKFFFLIYIYYVRDGMIRNYGDLYTSVIGVLWLFYLMCFFFYGACVCQAYKQRKMSTKLAEAV